MKLQITLQEASSFVPEKHLGDFKRAVIKGLTADSSMFGKDSRGAFQINAEYYRRAKDSGLTEEQVYDIIVPDKSHVSVGSVADYLFATDLEAYHRFIMDILTTFEVEVEKKRRASV